MINWFKKLRRNRQLKKLAYYQMMMARADLIGFEYEYWKYHSKVAALRKKVNEP